MFCMSWISYSLIPLSLFLSNPLIYPYITIDGQSILELKIFWDKHRRWVSIVLKCIIILYFNDILARFIDSERLKSDSILSLYDECHFMQFKIFFLCYLTVEFVSYNPDIIAQNAFCITDSCVECVVL